MGMWVNRLLAEAMTWVPKRLAWPFAQNYIAGEAVHDAIECVRQLNQEGCMATVDILGEFVRTPEEATEAANLYQELLDRIHQENLDANISVKLTQLGLLLDNNLCFGLISGLVAHAKQCHNSVRLDMEDSSCTDDTLAMYQRLRHSFPNVGIVLQAYMRRTLADAESLIEADMGNFRLCKGIYIEPYDIAYTAPEVINKNFTHVLDTMLKQKAYVGIATHDDELIWEAERLLNQHQPKPEAYEFQMLLGVRPKLRQQLLAQGHRVRIYIPFGKQWHAYSLRRFKENPTLLQHVIRNALRQLNLLPQPQ